MKILLLSDLHLVVDNPVARLDDLTEIQWDKLDWVYEYAKKNGVELVLQAGDLTHTKRSWSLLKRLTDFFLFMMTSQHGLLKGSMIVISMILIIIKQQLVYCCQQDC